jgi:hypothetical protein
LAQIRAKCGNTWTSYSAAVGFKTLAGGGSLSLTNVEANPALELNVEGSSTITLHPNPTNGRFVVNNKTYKTPLIYEK